MKRICAMMLLTLLALAGGSARAGDSLLRINCEGHDAGAEILVNGKFRGECPVDIKVKPGTLTLIVRKPLGGVRERAYEIELRMGEDTVKRVDAVLEERYTAAGKAQEDQRIRAEQAEAQRKELARQAAVKEGLRVQLAELAAQRQREALRVAAEAERARVDGELVAKLTAAAETGDPAAQARLGEHFRDGRGTAQDTERAERLFTLAAAAGNELALFSLNNASKSNPPDDVEAVSRMLRTPKEATRILKASGYDDVKALVNADPFFAMPAGGPEVAFSYQVGPTNMTMEGSCKRTGNLAQTKANQLLLKARIPYESNVLLGGLMPVMVVTQGVSLVAVESVYGAPFPLKTGKRFGAAYSLSSSDKDTSRQELSMSCMVTDVRIGTSGAVSADAPQLICMSEYLTYKSVTRWAFHKESGCFVGMRAQTF